MRSSYATILQGANGSQWALHTRHGEPHLEPFPFKEGDEAISLLGANRVDEAITRNQFRPVQIASITTSGRWHPFHGEVNVRVNTDEEGVIDALIKLGVFGTVESGGTEPTEDRIEFADWLDTDPPFDIIAKVVREIHEISKISGAPDLGFLV